MRRMTAGGSAGCKLRDTTPPLLLLLDRPACEVAIKVVAVHLEKASDLDDRQREATLADLLVGGDPRNTQPPSSVADRNEHRLTGCVHTRLVNNKQCNPVNRRTGCHPLNGYPCAVGERMRNRVETPRASQHREEPHNTVGGGHRRPNTSHLALRSARLRTR